jgi:hypothetical protein
MNAQLPFQRAAVVGWRNLRRKRSSPMKTVSLREITPENWGAIRNLPVRADQKNFMAGNLYSLAAAKVFPEHVPLAIYADEEPAGLPVGLPSCTLISLEFWH